MHKMRARLHVYDLGQNEKYGYIFRLKRNFDYNFYGFFCSQNKQKKYSRHCVQPFILSGMPYRWLDTHAKWNTSRIIKINNAKSVKEVLKALKNKIPFSCIAFLNIPKYFCRWFLLKWFVWFVSVCDYWIMFLHTLYMYVFSNGIEILTQIV